MEIIAALIGAVATLAAVLVAHFLKNGWNPAFQIFPSRYDFRRVLIHVAIARWRPSTSAAGPFEESKTIIFAGLRKQFDLWDESTVFAEWIPAKALPGGWSKTHATSGTLTFSPIYPPSLEMDEHRYRISEGNTLRFGLPSRTTEPILYSTRRFNAFQDNQQDFSVVLEGQHLRCVSLSLDFTGALSSAAFLQTPVAYITKSPSESTGLEVRLSTFHGRTWHLDYFPKRGDHRIRVVWKWTEAVSSDAPHFVFGYGSLMSLQSRSRTLRNAVKGNAIPAVLHGFKKTWSAYGPNRQGFKNEGESTPRLIAALNLEQAPGCESHGLLIPMDRYDMESLDQREKVYVRFDVTSCILPLSDFEVPPSAKIITYVSLSNPPSGEGSAVGIRQDYVELVLAACREIDMRLPQAMRKFEAEIHESLEVCRKASVQRLHPKATPDGRYTEGEISQQ